MAEISFLTQIPSIEQLVSTFSARERKPVESLEQKKTALNRRKAVLTDLKSNLSSLRSRLKGFTEVGASAKLAGKLAVSSDESIFTVEADASATIGINTILVSQIARNDIAATDSFRKTSSSIAEELSETTHVFTIQIGSGTAKSISITISSSSETNEDLLNRIAEAINTNVDDVSATVVSSTKTKVRLTIISKESGSENTISFADDDGSELLEELGLITSSNSSRKTATKTQGGFIITDTDNLDAIFEVNGIEITSSSNKNTDILKGVTIQLRKAQKSGSDPETFSISNDPDTIKDQIKAFIEEYNTSLKFLTNKLSVDASTNKRGDLAGNFTFINLRLELRTIISSPLSGVASGKPSLLSEIGLKINNDGTLEIDDEEELDDEIADNADAVTNLFTSDSGIANKLIDVLDKFTPAGKNIDKSLSTIRSQIFTVDRQITQFESRFRLREASLRRKFTDLQRALSLLNSQQALLQRFGFSSNVRFQFNNFSLSGQNQFRLF